MKYYVLFAMLTLCACIKSSPASAQSLSVDQDINFSVLGSYGVHNISASGLDSITMQTGAPDEEGAGSGINLISGNSVYISAGNNGNLGLFTNASDIDVISGGNVVMFANSSVGDYIYMYGESIQATSDHGLQLSQTASAPTCNSSRAGTLYYSAGGTGVADQLQVCMKAADDSFSWKNVNF